MGGGYDPSAFGDLRGGIPAKQHHKGGRKAAHDPAGGIGGGAQMALASVGIQLFGGVSGSCDEAVNALLANKLNFNPEVKCDHHDHGHGEGEHTCGNHRCGTHNCDNHGCGN